MGERLLCKQEVIGSIPFTSTGAPPLAPAVGLDDAERRPDGFVIASPVGGLQGKAFG